MICDPSITGTWVVNRRTYNAKPSYIGKGSGDRWKAHLYKPRAGTKLTPIRKAILQMRLAKFEPFVVLVKENLTEEEAFSLEEKLIHKLGRISTGGTLVNQAPGGIWIPSKVRTKRKSRKRNKK